MQDHPASTNQPVAPSSATVKVDGIIKCSPFMEHILTTLRAASAGSYSRGLRLNGEFFMDKGERWWAKPDVEKQADLDAFIAAIPPIVERAIPTTHLPPNEVGCRDANTRHKATSTTRRSVQEKPAAAPAKQPSLLDLPQGA